jgi:hypothetical protein
VGGSAAAFAERTGVSESVDLIASPGAGVAALLALGPGAASSDARALRTLSAGAEENKGA